MSNNQTSEDRIWGLPPGSETGDADTTPYRPATVNAAITQPAAGAPANPLDELEAAIGGAMPPREAASRSTPATPVPIAGRSDGSVRPPPIGDALAAAKNKALRENFGQVARGDLSQAPMPEAREPVPAPPAPVPVVAPPSPPTYEVSRPVSELAPLVREPIATAVEAPRDRLEDQGGGATFEDWSKPFPPPPSAPPSRSAVGLDTAPAKARAASTEHDDTDDDASDHAPMALKQSKPLVRTRTIVVLAALALIGVVVAFAIKPVTQMIAREAPVPMARNSPAPTIPAGAYDPMPKAAPAAQATASTESYSNVQRVESSFPGTTPPSPAAAPAAVANNPFQAQAIPPRSVPPTMPGQTEAASGYVPSSSPPAAPLAGNGGGQLRLSAAEADPNKAKFAEIFGAQDSLRKDVGGINRQLAGMKTTHDALSRKIDAFDAQLTEIRRAIAELRRVPIAAARPSQVASGVQPGTSAAAPAVPVVARVVKLQAIVPDFAVIGVDNVARTVRVGDDVSPLGRVARIDVQNTRVVFESGYELGVQ